MLCIKNTIICVILVDSETNAEIQAIKKKYPLSHKTIPYIGIKNNKNRLLVKAFDQTTQTEPNAYQKKKKQGVQNKKINTKENQKNNYSIKTPYEKLSESNATKELSITDAEFDDFLKNLFEDEEE